MKATLYKELSNRQTPIELPAGKSIKEALPDIDLENAIIVVNDKVVKPDYILKENDIVTIRVTPAAAITIAIIAVAVVAVTAGIIGGVALYKAKAAAEKAEEELEKVKKLTNKSDIDNRPFLRSASNTLATGNSQPYIIGRHFFTPYLLCSPHYQITGEDGKDEYTYTVLECGFNKQIIQKLAIDDIVIKSFSQTSPQEGAFNLDTGIFAEDGRVEIAQDGALLTDLSALNYKVESKACNDEIPHDSDVTAGTEEYLTYTLNPYAKDVDIAITFPYGLYAMNDDGYKIKTQLNITPQFSLDGGSTWQSFTFNNNGTQTTLFKRNESTKELRYVAHKDFTLGNYNALHANGQKAIYIRIRNNGNAGDSKIHNDCYCLFYQSVCFDPEKSTSELVPCRVVEDRERAYCTILGLKLKATKINEDKLKKINIISHGVARTWNGTAWSDTKAATRNPAAWALEILTSDSHPASKYNDSEIDLDSFGDYYEFCELNGYKFDYVITQNMKKDDVLNYIMEATGACIYTDIYGRRAVAFDHPQENALAVYNPQNIIDIQNKKTFGRRTDALRIKWVNSNDDLFQEDTYLLMREVDGVPLTLNENSIIKDITVTGITTFDHIVKYARRLMAVEILRPKTTIIEVGNEGIFYTPLSKILIQDDSLKIGIGKGYTIRECVWQSGLLKKIYTNELLTFDPQKFYGIIVNCYSTDDGKPVAIKVTGTGTTDELTVTTTLRSSAAFTPESGNIFSFGELDIDGEFSKVTTEYLISDIKRSDKGFNLDLVNYNEAIYDSGTIPEYKSNITKKATAEKKGIPADAVKHEELEEVSKAAIDAANEAVAVATSGVHFTNVHRIKAIGDIGGISGTSTLEALTTQAAQPIHGIQDTIESLRAAIDEVYKETTNGISVTDDKITLQVSDSEKKTYTLIELTADAIRSEVADLSDETQSEISRIDQRADSITATVESVQNDVSTIQTDLGTAQGDISQLEQTAQSITSTVQSLQSDISTAQTNISQLQQTASGLTSTVQSVQSDVSTLQSDMNTAQGDISTAQTNISQLQQTASGLTSTVQTVQGDVSALQGRTTTAENNITDLQGDVTQAQGSISQLQQTAETISAQVETNDHKQRVSLEMSQNDLIAKIDDALRDAYAGISIKADEITLQVEDGDAQLRATLQLTAESIIQQVEDGDAQLRATIGTTAEEILAQVDDIEEELTGLIDVQASAITAMVQGGGATGQMSLSLELPVMIDAATRAQFVQASTEAKVAAVYAQLEGTSGAGIRYAIKGNASNAAVKALWDDAVAGALIASQIDLTATQIHINAQNVQIDGETIINNAKKIKAAMIDVDTLLGNNAFFTGEIWAQESRFEKDVFLPMIEFCQSYSAATPIDIDMDTETPAAIKTKLDNILSYSRAINIDWDDTTNKRVYVYSVSNDKSRKNITPYSKASFYLQKYKDYQEGFIYYELGSVSAGTMFGSNSRLLISVKSNGTVIKHTSISESNKIRMSYYAKEFGVNASAFFGATIESRQGYQFYEPNRLLNQSYSYSQTSGDYWKYCRMLGVSTTPRLCCVKRNGGNYEIGVIYKESSNYVVNIAGVTKITFTEGSTSNSGVDTLMI